MELRYYFTYAAVFIFLQLFLYSFTRTLGWFFNLSITKRKALTLISYLVVNTIFLLQLARVISAFRSVALLLAFLLFAFLASIFTAFCYHLMRKKKSHWLRIAYPFILFGSLGLGVYNAYVPKVIHQTIVLDKPLDKPLRIGVASDFHLGKLFGGKQLDKLAEIFNQENVDLILLPGDIMDDNVQAYIAEDMRPHLAKLKAPLGVYATLGNHDFLGQQERITKEIEAAGIKVLWDQAVEIGNQFTIIGRNDHLYKKRPTTAELLQNVNTQKPVFLMDHRPDEIKIHSTLPIDLQVSGHTHRGQIFPANIVTYLMYRLDYGYEKIGNGHFVVTSGYGFWGIPLRLGSQSEVWILEVKGK